MKKLLPLILLLFCFTAQAQIENIIVITTDGFRWQEVFKGMDSVIAVNPAFNQKDSSKIFKNYWAATPTERREKLLPFIWNTVAKQGQIYGNRVYGNNVDNSNPYWFSFPGYSEIFTGFVDSAVNSNSYGPNPNTNVLEFINQQKEFAGSVAVFAAWDAMQRILNEQRSHLPIVCGLDSCGGANPDEAEKMLNAIKHDSYNPFWEQETLDVFTHFAAKHYLEKKNPRVLYVSYGETDEWAHYGQYYNYLNSAHQFDAWVSELWNYIQSSPQYKNKTALFITVDHGRGDLKKEQWTSHNNKISDSHQIWFAVMGPGIPAKGEIKTPMQLYQKQYAQTIAQLLGLNFLCEHPVADGLLNVIMK